MAGDVVIAESAADREGGLDAPDAITPLTEPLRFGVYTGVQVDSPAQQEIPAAAKLGLEPPRFCGQCGRRMIVQVVPDGWTARCSRHGRVDSTFLGRR
ncbi:biotin synthase auxiliary protein BsaP [Williamsia phyllosphaerae]|uniref:Biotin synthase auxiliary protein n=1 Tax=Williamsia phyllosphaerae TaxID=885042 RepID=A0ABQ1UZ59_9NOCA|nr:hypothetical protein [Williamsia phyllosphaerae]GGF29906.1 hypothetical protein GCM10007298_27320 [Williamsia phyllosphaerae]